MLMKEKTEVVYFGLEINEKSFKYVECFLGGDGVQMELDPKPCIHPQEILHGNEWPYKSYDIKHFK